MNFSLQNTCCKHETKREIAKINWVSIMWKKIHCLSENLNRFEGTSKKDLNICS